MRNYNVQFKVLDVMEKKRGGPEAVVKQNVYKTHFV